MTKLLLLLGLLACGATAVDLRLRKESSEPLDLPSDHHQEGDEADYLQSQGYLDDIKNAEEHAGEDAEVPVRSLLETRSEVQSSTHRGWYCGTWWTKCQNNRAKYFKKLASQGNMWCGGHQDWSGTWCQGCGDNPGQCHGECTWDSVGKKCRDHIPCTRTTPMSNCNIYTLKCGRKPSCPKEKTISFFGIGKRTVKAKANEFCNDDASCPEKFSDMGECGVVSGKRWSWEYPEGKGVCKAGQGCSKHGWCGTKWAHLHGEGNQFKYTQEWACNQGYPCIDADPSSGETSCPTADKTVNMGKCGYHQKMKGLPSVCQEGQSCSGGGWCGTTDAHMNAWHQPKYSYAGACCKVADMRDDKTNPEGRIRNIPAFHDDSPYGTADHPHRGWEGIPAPWHARCDCKCLDIHYRKGQGYHITAADSNWKEVPKHKHMVQWRTANQNECYCARVDSDHPLYGSFRYIDKGGAGWDKDYGMGQCNACDLSLSETHCENSDGKAANYMAHCELHDMCLGFHNTDFRKEQGYKGSKFGFAQDSGHHQCGTAGHMFTEIIQAATYARVVGSVAKKKAAALYAGVASFAPDQLFKVFERTGNHPGT